MHPSGETVKMGSTRGRGVKMRLSWLVLGGGPAGLTVAERLINSGEKSVLLIEKEKEAGGLCRSVNVDEAPIDIGGGHFLDVRNERVKEHLFSFL